jgi:hypothetical protein
MEKFNHLEIKLGHPVGQNALFSVKLDGQEIRGIREIIIRAGLNYWYPEIELTFQTECVSGIMQAETRGKK